MDQATLDDKSTEQPSASDIRQGRIDLGTNAEAWLNNKAVGAAVLSLRQRWFGELMKCSPGDLTAQATHAKLQVLEAIVLEVTRLQGDGAMARQGR